MPWPNKTTEPIKSFVKSGNNSYELITKGNDKEYKENDEVFIYWTLDDAIIIGANNEKKK